MGRCTDFKVAQKFRLVQAPFRIGKERWSWIFQRGIMLGVMLDLADMTEIRVEGKTLFVQSGCVLGQLIDALRKHSKAVPHGDCFGVGAGGHFLTAGWDLILARRYGLGCQSVIGGRMILWDGINIDVDETNHPDLLHAMRGSAAAGSGVVTEIRLRLIAEPASVTWRFTSINRAQLATCVVNNAFANAFNLPRDVSVSFRFYFEPDRLEPVCSFNIVSLLPASETIHHLAQHLGPEDYRSFGMERKISCRFETVASLRLLNRESRDAVRSLVCGTS